MAEQLNLKKLSIENEIKLSIFFEQQTKNGVTAWGKNKIYFFHDRTEFQFKNDLYQRQRKKRRGGFRYEIISNKDPIGKGGFGVVKKIKGTLAYNRAQFNFKKYRKNGRRRVVKIQHRDSINSIKKEYKLSKLAKQLAIKKPNIIPLPNSTFQSCFTMDELPGKSLFEILQNDRNKIRILTTIERIQLSQLLLLALKQQVTDLGIVHRDIKLENILVDLGPPIVVNIIDYGLAMEANNPDNASVGSPWYVAPEMLLNPSSTSAKADVFSMARVIALFWNINFKTYRGFLNEIINYTPLERLEDLFKDIHDLAPEDSIIIKNTLLSMLVNDPEKRISLDEAIARFALLGQNNPERLTLMQNNRNATTKISFFEQKKVASENLLSGSESSKNIFLFKEC